MITCLLKRKLFILDFFRQFPSILYFFVNRGQFINTPCIFLKNGFKILTFFGLNLQNMKNVGRVEGQRKKFY